ncbi:MAG: xanthine dehydrogenase accessory protein XdhC [Betaproteobacteria bacterium]
MTAWIGDLAGALKNGRRAVLVTIAHTSGSAPREPGTAMVVTEAAFHGSIGGGHLEHEALTMARDALANAHTPASTWIVRFPLAARLGQCCGGVATLAFTAVAAGSHVWLDAALTCVRTSTPFALVTRVGGAQDAPSKLLVTMDDAHSSLADWERESAAISAARARLASGEVGAGFVAAATGPTTQLLIEVVRPDAFPVLVFGNGHVGRALVHVLRALPAHIRWIDEREADFPAAVPDHIEIVATDAPEDEIARAPHGAFLIVLTHSHPRDFAIVEAALARQDWRYLGMIGSRSKRAQFERRLAARGMAPEVLARLVCPIGIHGGLAIRSKEPGAIAIAVAAEIIAARDASAWFGADSAHAGRFDMPGIRNGSHCR